MRILPIPLTPNDPAPTDPLGAEAYPLWQSEINQCLRDNDFLLTMPDGSVQVLAHMEPQYGEPVALRLIERMARTPLKCASGARVRWGACVGMAHFPVNGDRAGILIEQARQAAETAMQSGRASCHQELPSAALETAETETEEMPPETAKKILDEVTGVLRTERLGTAMQKLVALRRKEELGVSAVYLAIEDIPVYEQRYGQDAANHILKTVADLLAKHSRETDLLARAGAAEFLIGMDCAPEQALAGAQRLVNIIKRVTIRRGRMSLRVNVTAGVAGYPDHANNAKAIYEAAEQATIKARSRGRSIAVLYEPEPQKVTPQPTVVSASEF